MSRLNRVVVVAVLVVGVMLPSAGGVVGAKPQPAPGGVCSKVGQVVSAPVPLVCKQTAVKGLRWRKAPIPTMAVVPSTTLAVVPTVSLAATFLDSGTFPKAAVVTANVAGTVYFIEGASPVTTVSDITSARNYRWTSGAVAANTPTSIGLDVDVLTNGYYRVFVANSQGVLSAPAVNKVTISISRASDVAALTCATGGTCAVGDTGPGGGIVFYVASGTFTQTGATGSMCTTACRYLEAAPTNWLTGTTGDPRRSWATDINSNRTTAVSGADGTAIGSGYKNSLDIVAQAGNVVVSSGAVLAREYGGGSKSDWFLPSKDELNQMCKWQRGQLWVSDSTICNDTGTLNSGRGASGFSSGYYWSSSEGGASLAWAQHFNDAIRGSSSKFNEGCVRPVRAF